MKKLFRNSSLAIIALIFVASNASAIPFSDLDTINTKLTANSQTSTYSGTFNIVDDGFIPGYHSVWGALITFCLSDDNDSQSETFSINLDSAYNTTHLTSFLVLGITQVGVNLLASLNADGVLNYSVTATSGDFWLESALLCADATIQTPLHTQAVPDNGSTLILAALAMASLVFAARRLQVVC